ncbi:MAG: type IV toxin-antitoxin system AbiEi family antitoxin domain-containing protein [Candidatus Parvarchaeum sp.]
MNMYEITKELEKMKEKVFSIDKLAALTGLSLRSASVLVNRMAKKKLVYKIERGKFSLSDDPFIVASNIVYPAYLSFSSAFYIYGLLEQVINEVYVATPKKTKDRNFNGSKVVFVKIPESLMFGFKKIDYARGVIPVAEKEKAFVDSLAYTRYVRINFLDSIIKEMDRNLLEKYAEMSNIEAVKRRLGFLLEKNGIETKIKIRGKTVYKLNPSIRNTGVLNSKWKLYVNEEL